MKLPNTPNPTATNAIALGAMTATERAMGRFMRAPDGHDGGDAGGAAGADAAAATAGTTTDSEGDNGGEETSVLGGAGSESGTEAGAAKEGEGGEGEGEAAAAASVPEKYELATPDGFEAIDTEVLAEAEPVLRELSLTNDQANKLMPLAGQLVKRTMDRAEKAITERAVSQRKEWSDAFEADPDIGGTNKDATLAAAARAFDHYGIKKGEGVRQLLDESGLGNHPELIRFVARVGRDLEEGSFERGTTTTTPKALEQKLYGAEFQPK